MNLLECLITQQTIDNHDPWNLEFDRLITRRLEYEPSLVTELATQKGVYETLDVFARVCNVSDGIERIGRRGRGTSVRFLRRIVSQKLPLDVWKLTLKCASRKL
jgi:hypothetical protein